MALATGDFVLIAPEVNKVARKLREHARGLRAALDLTNSAKVQ